MSEFCTLTGCMDKDLSTRWLDIKGRVLAYVAHEERKIVKNILTQYNTFGESSGIAIAKQIITNC